MNKPLKMAIAIALLSAIGPLDLQYHLAGVPLSFVAPAEARVGRPLTPVSVAGVARRTSRRVIRRSTIFVPALPAGCVVTPIDGANYWRCGATYYAASGAQFVVVYID